MPHPDRRAPHDPQPGTSPRRARGCGGCAVRLLIALVVLVALAVAALAFVPDWVVAGRVAEELEARGVTCDPIDTDVSLLLDRVVVAPTRCTIREGSVASIELADALVIELAGLEPTAVRAGRIVVALREDLPEVQPDAAGPLLRALGVADRLVGLVHASAAIAEASPPAATATRVEVVRANEAIATLHEVTLAEGQPLRIQIARADLPSRRAHVTLRNVEGTASAATVALSAEVEVDADLPLVGRTQRSATVSVEATALDTARPRWSIHGGL